MEASLRADATLWPEDVTVGEVIYPPGSTFGPRTQYHLQLVMVHSGEMTVWIDGDARHAPAHTVGILLPGHEERFAFAQEEETHHSWLHASLPCLSSELRARFALLPWPLPLSPLMQQLTHDVLAMQDALLPTSKEILKAMAMHMLWLYIGEGEMQMRQQMMISHPAVEEAQRFIQGHLDDSLTLATIAQAVAVSPSHLVRLFQAQLHTTPMAYLWDRRVAKGVELLEQTGLTVKTIAERCGFQTRYHFSRRVRQTIGYSPLEVRRRSWLR